MTDLTKGIIDFGEFTLTPETTKNDLMAAYGSQLSKISNDKYIKFKRAFKIDGAEFGCWFYLDNNYFISSIELYPYIDYKSEEWDRTGQQEERRKFCDNWLLERLGEPISNFGGASYKYSSIDIDVITHFDQKNGADAGYILISYLR